VLAVHALHVLGSFCVRKPQGRDKQWVAAGATHYTHREFATRKAAFGDTDDGDTFVEMLVKMRAKAFSALRVEYHVAIDNDDAWLRWCPLQHSHDTR
jgi:hypothetical protein